MRDFAPHMPVNLSPDGRLVVYTIVRPTNEDVADDKDFTATGVPIAMRATDVWITDTQSGRAENLTQGRGANWGGAWSPDGTLLAFYSDRDGVARTWIWERRTGVLRSANTAKVRSHGFELQWTRDGKELLVGLLPETMQLSTGSANDGLSETTEFVSSEGVPLTANVRVFRSEASASNAGSGPQRRDRSAYLKDLALIDVRSGQIRVVAKEVHSLRTLLSPDGNSVAFADESENHVAASHVGLYDLKSVRLDTGEVRTLMHEQPLGSWGLDFSWSPDSKAIAVRSGGHEFSDVYRVSVAGEVRPVTGAAHPLFKGLPVWDDAGRYLYLITEDALWTVSTHDGVAREIARLPGKVMKSVVTASANRDRVWLRNGGRAAVVVAGDAVHSGLYEVELASGKVHALLEEERQYVVDDPRTNADNLIASPQLRGIVYVAEDAQHPPDLWLATGNLSRPRQLGSLNPEINAIPMGARRVLSWRGIDGRTYQGILLLPSNYRPGQQYPLVTYVYPIDVLPYANKFGSAIGGSVYNLQLLATRGYAVLFSGATLQPEDKEPMKSVPAAVLPGVDRVIAMGIADPTRLGVFGTSAGGYSVLALLVQSTRFRAAVTHAGAGNLLSLYGDLQNSGYSHGLALDEATFKMPENPWDDRDRYIRNSPWFFLDRVQTPLLLLHGMKDEGTIVTQANEIFSGLKVLGKEVEYARYNTEGHGFSMSVNAVDAAERYIAWFDCHLKNQNSCAQNSAHVLTYVHP